MGAFPSPQKRPNRSRFETGRFPMPTSSSNNSSKPVNSKPKSACWKKSRKIAKFLLEKDRKEQFHKWLVRGISEHSIPSEVLTWLDKERGEIHFSDLVGPDLTPAILSALEREQCGKPRRNSKLHDLLIDDKELIPE